MSDIRKSNTALSDKEYNKLLDNINCQLSELFISLFEANIDDLSFGVFLEIIYAIVKTKEFYDSCLVNEIYFLYGREIKILNFDWNKLTEEIELINSLDMYEDSGDRCIVLAKDFCLAIVSCCGMFNGTGYHECNRTPENILKEVINLERKNYTTEYTKLFDN